VLRAITAIGDHEVDAVSDRGSCLVSRIAIAVCHADVPPDTVFAKGVIEDVEDGLILAGGRVDDHMHPPIRGIRHQRPPAARPRSSPATSIPVDDTMVATDRSPQ
jgi:hypothetical protein